MPTLQDGNANAMKFKRPKGRKKIIVGWGEVMLEHTIHGWQEGCNAVVSAVPSRPQ